MYGIALPAPRELKILIVNLKIPEERVKALLEEFKDVATDEKTDPMEDLKKFIGFTKKANELTLLVFLYGMHIGTNATLAGATMAMPDLLNRAAQYGAMMSQKQTPPTNQPENPKEADDRQYG